MREGQKDSLIIADLAADCVENKVMESALNEICKEIRHEATTSNPFLPPSGEILKRAIARTQSKNPKQWERAIPREAKEKAPTVDWAFMKFQEIKDSNLLDKVRQHLSELSVEKRWPYRNYLTEFCKFPKDWS